MKLSEFLTPDRIRIPLQAATKKSVIEELSQVAVSGSTLRISDFVPLILQRESVGPTGLGNGIALPHCRLKGVGRPLLALGRLVKPIGWESADSKPVDIFWLSVSPDFPNPIDLKILSLISKLMSHADFVVLFRQVQSPQAALSEIIRIGF